MKLKGIIFDFNGVLWWDTEIQEKVWKEFASELAKREISNQELLEHMHGRPNKYFLEYLTNRTLSDKEVKDLTDMKESKYREQCLSLGSEFKLSPGAKELLDTLKENNVPRTIATASEIRNITFFFKELDLNKWFDFNSVVYDDGIIRGKPFPDKYIKAAGNIGLKPEQAVVIEDSSSGIRAALSAKIGRVYGLGNNQARKENLEKIEGVYKVISTLKEISAREIFDLNT